MPVTDIPPVPIVEHYKDFNPKNVFKTKKEAIDFITKHGGVISEDPVRNKFLVIRVPAEDKK